MKVIVLLSGKRKSGKDFVADRLKCDLQAAGLTVAIVRISEPLKREYARLNELNLDELLSSSEYKEKFRSDMVEWGEQIRNRDPGYFCRLAVQGDNQSNQICIVSDCRRPSDLKYFINCHSSDETTLMKIRINSDDISRINRGWKFVNGIDDAETECALDDETGWDVVLINNDSDKEGFEKSLTSIEAKICVAVRNN